MWNWIFGKQKSEDERDEELEHILSNIIKLLEAKNSAKCLSALSTALVHVLVQTTVKMNEKERKIFVNFVFDKIGEMVCRESCENLDGKDSEESVKI